jgi:hypothetical protein
LAFSYHETAMGRKRPYIHTAENAWEGHPFWRLSFVMAEKNRISLDDDLRDFCKIVLHTYFLHIHAFHWWRKVLVADCSEDKNAIMNVNVL